MKYIITLEIEPKDKIEESDMNALFNNPNVKLISIMNYFLTIVNFEQVDD